MATIKSGADKRAAAAAKAERAAAKAAAKKAASFADIFRTDFEVHYVNDAGEARVRECRTAQDAATEKRWLEERGYRVLRTVDVRPKAAG